MRYTGKPYPTVVGLKVVKGGLRLTFSEKLDPKSAGDAENYTGQQWNYLWCSDYGSQPYRPTPGFEEKMREYNRLRLDRRRNAAALQKLARTFVRGHDPVKITAAKVSADGKTVLPTDANILALADNDTLEVSPGDEITISYTDQINTRTPGEARVLSSKLKATYFNASVSIISYDVKSGAGGVSRAVKPVYRIDPGDRIIAVIND